MVPSLQPPLGSQLLVGAAAAAVSVPASMFLASWYGTMPRNLYAALVPTTLFFLVAPPLAVVGAEWLLAKRTGAEMRFVPTWLVTTGLHLGAMLGAIALGASTRDLGQAALFTALEVVLLPTAATLTARMMGPKDRSSPPETVLPAARPETMPSHTDQSERSLVTIPLLAGSL